MSDSDRQSSVFGQLVKHSLLLPFQTLILLPVYFFSINPSVMLVEGTDASSVPPHPHRVIIEPNGCAHIIKSLSFSSLFLATHPFATLVGSGAPFPLEMAPSDAVFLLNSIESIAESAIFLSCCFDRLFTFFPSRATKRKKRNTTRACRYRHARVASIY